MATDLGLAGSQRTLLVMDEAGVSDAVPYQLLEMDDAVMESLRVGDRVYIKGPGVDEEAVLCTSSSTYQLKFADTSNSLLLATPASPAVDAADQETAPDGKPITHLQRIHGNLGVHLELKSMLPRLDTLYKLLHEAPRAGGKASGEESNLTWDYLLAHVQASEEELRNALESLFAVEVDGRYYLVDETLEDKAFDLILTTAEAENWDFDKVSVAQCIAALKGHDIPSFAIRHALLVHGQRRNEESTTGTADSSNGAATEYGNAQKGVVLRVSTGGSTGDTCVDDGGIGDDVPCWVLAQEPVCRFRAESLLRLAHPQTWNRDEFLSSWDNSVPLPFKVDPKYLAGLCIEQSETDKQLPTLRYFPAAQLRRTHALAQDRFRALFEAQAKWPLDALIPYVSDLCQRTKLDVLLLKYARMSSSKNGKLYSAK